MSHLAHLAMSCSRQLDVTRNATTPKRGPDTGVAYRSARPIPRTSTDGTLTRMANPVASVVALCVLVATAHAETKVDWARGLVVADAIGIADRHAPNPAVARGTSRRGAEANAKKLIAAKLAELPLAGGGKIGDRASDAEIKARLARAIDGAITLGADPETDGAWRVTMAVPIEAVRQALVGPRALGEGDKGPRVIVIEGVSAKPAVGWKVGGVDAATIWVRDVPTWAKDAPRVKAKSAKAGAIDVAGIDATAATLFVIVTKP